MSLARGRMLRGSTKEAVQYRQIPVQMRGAVEGFKKTVKFDETKLCRLESEDDCMEEQQRQARELG